MITETKGFSSEYPEHNLYDMQYFSYLTLQCSGNLFVVAEDVPKYARIEMLAKKTTLDEDLNASEISKSFTYVACSTKGIEDFYSKLEETTLSKKLFDRYSICLNVTSEDREWLSVEGKSSDSKSSSITITMNPCSPGNGVECKSDEEIGTCALIPAKIQYSFDPSNYKSPVKRMSTFDDYIVLDLLGGKYVSYYLERVEIINNRIDFWGDTESISYLDIFETIQNNFRRDSDDSPLVTITLASSGSVRRIQRQYTMMIDTIGNMGGVFQICCFIALTLYWCKNSMYATYMRREVMHHDIEELSKYFPSKSKKEIQNLIDDMIDHRKDANNTMSDMNQLDLLLRAILKPHHRALIPLVLLKEEEIKKKRAERKKTDSNQLLFEGVFLSQERMNFKSAYNLVKKDIGKADCPEIQKLVGQYLVHRLKDTMEPDLIIDKKNSGANHQEIVDLNILNSSDVELKKLSILAPYSSRHMKKSPCIPPCAHEE